MVHFAAAVILPLQLPESNLIIVSGICHQEWLPLESPPSRSIKRELESSSASLHTKFHAVLLSHQNSTAHSKFQSFWQNSAGPQGRRPQARLAEQTEGMNGSDLLELCSRAAALAAEEHIKE